MQIQFTGQNIDITPALREYTTEKFKRVIRHCDKIISINVIFIVDKLTQIAEANLHIPGADLHAKAESDNMYKSILNLVEKLIRQLEKHK